MKACTWWVVQALAASGLPLCSCPDSGHSHAHAAAGWKDKAVTSKHCFWMKPSHPCLSTPSPLPLMVQAKEFAVAYAQVECEGIKALTRISLSWEAPSTRSLPAEAKLVNLNFSKAKQSRWGVLAQLGTNFSWEMAKKKRLHYFLSELKMGLKSGWVLPGSRALIEFLGKKAAAHD